MSSYNNCLELLDIINKQEEMIAKQNEVIGSLVNETVEQDSIISTLMQEHIDT